MSPNSDLRTYISEWVGYSIFFAFKTRILQGAIYPSATKYTPSYSRWDPCFSNRSHAFSMAAFF